MSHRRAATRIRRWISGAIVVGALALIGYAAIPRPLPETDGPPIDPMRFFEGDTQGAGVLTIALVLRHEVRVRGTGTRRGAELELVQIVTQGDSPPRRRVWLLRPDGPDRWAGTLTDADGPVTVEREGARLMIRYRDSKGFHITQTLVATGQGQVHNRLVARRFGLRLAVLDETITRD